MARHGWTGTQAAFGVDREAARRDLRADVESSGRDYDAELEATPGAVYGRPVRTMAWSARDARVVWWQYDAARAKWVPEGVERGIARKLRVELSDANEGKSVEEVFEERLKEAGRE